MASIVTLPPRVTNNCYNAADGFRHSRDSCVSEELRAGTHGVCLYWSLYWRLHGITLWTHNYSFISFIIHSLFIYHSFIINNDRRAHKYWSLWQNRSAVGRAARARPRRLQSYGGGDVARRARPASEVMVAPLGTSRLVVAHVVKWDVLASSLADFPRAVPGRSDDGCETVFTGQRVSWRLPAGLPVTDRHGPSRTFTDRH